MFFAATFFTLLIASVNLLSLYIYIKLKVPKNFPPGPYLPLPILRKLPWSRFYGLNEIQAFDKVRKDYGNTFSAHIGYRRIVMMSEYETVKEVFAKKVTQRPEEIVNHWRDGRYGVIFANGDDWKIQRRLFLEVLKSSGFGKGVIEHSIELIWPQMKEIMETSGEIITSKSFDLPLLEFLVFTFCDPSVLPDGRPPKSYLDCFNISRFFGIQWSEFELWYRFPILRILAPKWSGYTPALEVLQKSHKALEEIVRLHEENPSEDRKDFIDIYLKKLKECEETGDPKSLLYGESGKKCVIATLDNILVGGDGIFLGMNAVFYALARYPKVQEKLREELKEVIPSGHNLSLELDKKNLIYSQAFQMEVQRFIDQSGYGAAHHVAAELDVDGYTIPTKTDVFCNMYHVMRDARYWDEPEMFKPERFIDANTGKITIPPQWIPFEVGPRMCPGRNFAFDVMIALTSKILLEYKIEYGGRVIEARKGEFESTVPTFGGDQYQIETGDEDVMDFVGMVLIQPKPFALKFERLVNKETSLEMDNVNMAVLKKLGGNYHIGKELEASSRQA